MSELVGARPPGWFRLLSILALVWNLIGVAMYLQKVGLFGDPLAGLSDAERTLAESVPAWVTGAFAIAVFSGLVGAIGMVLLKKWSLPLLTVSLLGVLAQCGWILFVSEAREVHGLTGIAMPALITLIAILLVWLARTGSNRGWLG